MRSALLRLKFLLLLWLGLLLSKKALLLVKLSGSVGGVLCCLTGGGSIVVFCCCRRLFLLWLLLNLLLFVPSLVASIVEFRVDLSSTFAREAYFFLPGEPLSLSLVSLYKVAAVITAAAEALSAYLEASSFFIWFSRFLIQSSFHFNFFCRIV